MSTNSLEVQQVTNQQVLEDIKLADILYKSGYFDGIKSASQAFVKILRGRELGIPPIASLEGIYVVNGKTALTASLIAALIKKAGAGYKISEHTDKVCTITFTKEGRIVGESTFSIEDANKAGISNREAWKKYPKNMLFARAISNGARWFFPEIFGGAVYTPEELTEDLIDSSIIEVKVEESQNPSSPIKVEQKKQQEEQQKEEKQQITSNDKSQAKKQRKTLYEILSPLEGDNFWNEYWKYANKYKIAPKTVAQSLGIELENITEISREDLINTLKKLIIKQKEAQEKTQK